MGVVLMQIKQKIKVLTATAAAVAATSVGVLAAPAPAWAAYDVSSCTTCNGYYDCQTRPWIKPHQSQYWLRYYVPSGQFDAYLYRWDPQWGPVEVASTRSGTLVQGTWTTKYNLNPSQSYYLRLHQNVNTITGTASLKNYT